MSEAPPLLAQHSREKAGSRDPGSHDFFRAKLGKILKIRKNTQKIRKNTEKSEKYVKFGQILQKIRKILHKSEKKILRKFGKLRKIWTNTPVN